MSDWLTDCLPNESLYYGDDEADPLRDLVGPDGSGIIIHGRRRQSGPGDEASGTADVLRGRFAHTDAAVKAHDAQVQRAFQQRKVDLALNKGVQAGTIGTDYVQPWLEWMSGYLEFEKNNVPDMWSDDAAIGAQLANYDAELVQWIARFKAESGTTEPVTVFTPPPPPSPGAPGGFWGGEKGEGGLADILGQLKWVAVLAVGLYVLAPALPSVAQAVGRAVK